MIKKGDIVGNTALTQRSAQAQALYEGLDNLESSKRFTREQLEVIYALGYAHVVQGQYAQALPILAFLAQYGPTQQHYLYGLALSLQMLDRLDEAIGIYSLCSLLFPESSEATQRIAQCHVSAGRLQEACDTLNELLQHAMASHEVELEAKVRGMLDRIQKHAAV